MIPLETRCRSTRRAIDYVSQKHSSKLTMIMLHIKVALGYIDKRLSSKTRKSWMDSFFTEYFFANSDTADGYMLKPFVCVPDERGIFFLPLTRPPFLKTRGKTFERVMNMLSETLNGMPSLGSTAQCLLWDFYDTLDMFMYRDITHPTYAVSIGEIITWTGTHFGAPNAKLLASLPSEVPTSHWEIRNDLLKKDDSFTSTLRTRIVHTEGYIRVCLPLHDTYTSDFELVIDAYPHCHPNRSIWADLERAYASQIAHLCSLFNYEHYVEEIGLVTGFSWHLKVSDIAGRSEEHPDANEIYLTIEKPQLHAENLTLYWSLDSTGSKNLDPSQLLSFGLTSNSITTWKTLVICQIAVERFNLIWEIHEKLGLDPESDEAARLLGLPLMEFYGLNDEGEPKLPRHYYRVIHTQAFPEYDSEGGSSLDSYHTAYTEDEDEYVDCE
ncbi:hypothetical protein M422DRAFT_44379 [Sphaerobolus stellatus SS14]|nr:hypothetical protein M422DRAFT_44379 [Sphaerobolus stellatus SS14]